jgi:putative transposase
VTFSILHALAPFIADLAKSCSRLEAENLLLRHQLNVALRKAPADPRLRNCDRAILVWLIQLWPNLLGAVGFRAFWSWKSKSRAGRPKIHRTLRDLIQRMYRENPLWGAPRIHGELLMLGIEVAQTKVAKYMMRGANHPCRTGRLSCASTTIAAIDMCVVPTVTFDWLLGFLVLGIR